eukprot:CAMPEP_0172874778 /NCGR_PEP_ID=MMETSP1075-20121228/99371_1 /TAXON_ID=2916 /ORGANISM="Ceratium fusus, Strain PA161109" /LENGTH=67 /DNA_ID=CAMNT_0013725675 /DNA_START=277 /DNA_END=480 /DNA_ORIENTATION=-
MPALFSNWAVKSRGAFIVVLSTVKQKSLKGQLPVELLELVDDPFGSGLGKTHQGSGLVEFDLPDSEL